MKKRIKEETEREIGKNEKEEESKQNLRKIRKQKN